MLEIDKFTYLFGYIVGCISFIYLGLPLGVSHRSVGVCDSFEERFERRLATWNKQYLKNF